MEKIKFIAAYYELADRMKIQGCEAEVRPYLKYGYRAVMESGNEWLLVKPIRVIAKFQHHSGVKTFDIKDCILRFYGENQISSEVFQQFCQEAESGKIKFYLEDNYLIIR